MTGESTEDELHELSKGEIEKELNEAQARIAQLESELAETNEGMVALTMELENAKDRYQTLFERGTDAILLIDPERRTIHDVNPTACELFGYPEDELLSLTMSDLFPDESEQFGTLASSMVHGWGGDYTARTKRGRRLTVNLSTSKVTLHDKLYLLASFRDVTLRKQRQQRLEVLTRVFRHNLRNDGNVIQGHADLLRDGVEDPALSSSAEEIRIKIDRLLDLSSKVRRIQEVVERDHVPRMAVADLLNRQEERYEDSVADGTIRIQPLQHDAEVDQALDIAIREAIDNAILHGEDPTVQVSAEIDQEEQRVTIEVADDGPGIPDDELDAIRSGTETPLVHGSGIGLWTIHWVVHTIGGELTVTSPDDGGSRVSMTVPFNQPGSMAAGQPQDE